MSCNLTEAAAASACSVPTHRGPCVMTAGHADRCHRAVPRMPLEYARARAFERGQSVPRTHPDPLSDPALPCRSMNPELFFPVSASGPSLDQVTQAKAICARCPVRQQCLAFALDTRQDHGVWEA